MAQVSEYFREQGVTVSPMSRDEKRGFERRWLETFAANVKKAHRSWIYRGFRWHGFSYDLQPCESGAKALGLYLDQWPADYVVFDESLTECFQCRSERYHDLSSLRQDIYVTHANLKWTMVFTHEQPDLGPYFAIRDAT